MAYDEHLAARVRERLGSTDGVVELKMFGGWGVTVHGNMAVGVMERDLIVRVGPEAFDDALARPGARPFDFTGRPMTGWVFVASQAVANGRSLSAWVARGVDFARSLPPKSTRKASRSNSGLKRPSSHR
jgi:TfoX/Sxy family transcriptional regulator of competence genes